ncbi:MFS general substrate transporter [Athelia psychrophila]|uniref:MFS general substrate transporter n=1 Tax=Athelia psychrophila TaxID=1759441 RepID=A0A166F917_9AGAM|nr:MFS general substrate transporter [Fibularhizoctonia sp. CBS 109695]
MLLKCHRLSYGCLLLVFARLADIIGGRKMFLIGSAWSIAIAFAPNDIAFIIFTALLAIGSACNTPAAFGILSSYFPPGPKRNAAYGALGAGQPVGYIMGIVIGVSALVEDQCGAMSTAGLGFFFVAIGWVVLDRDQNNPLHTKGLDWGGVPLSMAGFGLLTYSLADSTTAKKGWATPQIPSLLSVSLVLIGLFVYYERWRDSKGNSVLVPMSIWRHPTTRMGRVILLVFFSWWAFNTITYFATLYYQEVNLHNPLQTSLRFSNGHCRVGGQTLIVVGLCGTTVAPLIFALIDVNESYWSMMFFVMLLTVGADTVYPVGNLHFASTFDQDSQSLAGGIFNVATRLGASIGLAVTSSIATATSEKYNAANPTLAANSPEVFMVGFRAAGWTCFAAGAVPSVIIGAVGLRGMGIVGSVPIGSTDSSSAIELKDVAAEKVADGPFGGMFFKLANCRHKHCRSNRSAQGIGNLPKGVEFVFDLYEISATIFEPCLRSFTERSPYITASGDFNPYRQARIFNAARLLITTLMYRDGFSIQFGCLYFETSGVKTMDCAEIARISVDNWTKGSDRSWF